MAGVADLALPVCRMKPTEARFDSVCSLQTYMLGHSPNPVRQKGEAVLDMQHVNIDVLTASQLYNLLHTKSASDYTLILFNVDPI